MRGDGVLFSAEGASRAGLGCCTPQLASNFRSENASMMSRPALDHAAVVFAEQTCFAVALAKAGHCFRATHVFVGSYL